MSTSANDDPTSAQMEAALDRVLAAYQVGRAGIVQRTTTWPQLMVTLQSEIEQAVALIENPHVRQQELEYYQAQLDSLRHDLRHVLPAAPVIPRQRRA